LELASRKLRSTVAFSFNLRRLKLVDEPAGVVAPLLEAYRAVVAGERRGAEVVEWVGTLPDANGRSHGAGRGSLETRQAGWCELLKPVLTAPRCSSSA
jgi:hypothetical protein